MKTADYSKFTFLKRNRTLQRGLIDRLKKSISSIGYIEARPIIVNKKFQVLDGQNRLIACQELGIPVHYVIHENDKCSDDRLISELNKNQLIWRLSDFIHHYAEKNVKSHKEIRDFDEKYKLGTSNAIILCCKAVHQHAPAIRDGKDIALNPNRFAAAEFILSCNKLPFYKSSLFVGAIKVLFMKANQKHIDKLLRKHLTIPRQPSREAYLNVFMNIINKNITDDQKIAL